MNLLNVYCPTWGEPLDISTIPGYMNTITLSFFRTNPAKCSLSDRMDRLFYDGDLTLAELKHQIDIDRERHPARMILASVGGEIAGNFEDINVERVVDGLVLLGLDGIDIDYEPNGVMTESEEEIDMYIRLISTLRMELDRRGGKRLLLSCAPTGIGLLEPDNFSLYKELMDNISSRLKLIIPEEEWEEELLVGSPKDDNIWKQKTYRVGSCGSLFNFNSAGKMNRVFKKPYTGFNDDKYHFIGQMVDIVMYQAYNVGSGNTLGKLLCYETHRLLSDFFESDIEGSGFRIGHGSHVGQEAWPHYSYTKKRLGYIYSYIREYGRVADGASFWSLTSSFIDEGDSVPVYGMELESTEEVFSYTANMLRGSNED